MTPTVLLVLTLIVGVGALVLQGHRHAAALRESEAKVRTLIDNAPEAVVILDTEAGTFVDVNERAVQLFGRPREELLRLGPVDVSPVVQPTGSASADLAATVIAEAVQGGTPAFEWWHKHASGDLVPCEIRLVRIPSRTNTLVRGAIVDISDRKAAEERQRALEEQLHQSSKLEAVGQLTGGVAHDFNNILTVAMGNLELLTDRLVGDQRVLVDESLAALSRGATLTSRLLAFSRRQPLRPEVVDVGALVRGMTGLLRRTLGETIEIHEAIEEGLWRCRTDRAQLENAIVNLAINARDAMAAGGELRIAVTNVRPSRTELERWFGGPDAPGSGAAPPEPAEFVEIAVSDTGTGMERDTLKRAFDPFFTTKEVGKGSGLGLSMIYGFARQSGGHVDIESEVGHGTTVRLRLPRVCEAEPQAEVAPAEVEQPGSRARGGRVLLVEDDPGVRQVGVAFLESMGFTCVPVADATEALRILKDDTAFDLLFTDVVLPGGMNGVELARQVRTRLPELPIVFCSGYSEEMVEDVGAVRGLGPLVAKPYTREDLAAVL